MIRAMAATAHGEAGAMRIAVRHGARPYSARTPGKSEVDPDAEAEAEEEFENTDATDSEASVRADETDVGSIEELQKETTRVMSKN